MKKQYLLPTLAIFVVFFTFYPFLSYAKSKPSTFSDLVKNSDLIAVVNVFAISSQGKSKPGSASATVRKTIIGHANNKTIKLQWSGIAITELGEWLVFLSKNHTEGKNKYDATYGARSFWKIEYAEVSNKCCSQFSVLRQPLNLIQIDPSLFSEQFAYINGVPRDKNPIKVRGILLDTLVTYVKKIINKE